MSSVLGTAGRLLNGRRLGYAWIAGGLLWATWLASVCLGHGGVDLAGQVIGTDYLQFHTAGLTLLKQEASHLYDLVFQSQMQQDLIGPNLRYYHAFINPPFMALLYVPLARLPYRISFAVWSLASAAFLAASIRLLGASRPWLCMLWSATWFPVFASVSFGQNSMLSLLLLSIVYRLWRRERCVMAGLVLSLLGYKPQLMMGLLLLWLWRRQWRALLAVAGGSLVIWSISLASMPEAMVAYVQVARQVLPDLPSWQQFPLWQLHTVRGFWRLLLPGWTSGADALTAASTVACLLVAARFAQRYRSRPELLFGGAVCLTLAITPHAMIYDWSLLLIPAILVWQHVPEQRSEWLVLFAALWIAAFISGPLVHPQLATLGWAVQLSVPVLLAVTARIGHQLGQDVSGGSRYTSVPAGPGSAG